MAAIMIAMIPPAITKESEIRVTNEATETFLVCHFNYTNLKRLRE